MSALAVDGDDRSDSKVDLEKVKVDDGEEV